MIPVDARRCLRHGRGPAVSDDEFSELVESGNSPAAKRIAELEREVADLREILPKVLDALGNGSVCSPSCSVDFMRQIPNEARLVVDELKRELEQERHSPYVDSDESHVEVLAAIYDALDGITDDSANGRNFGTLLSRVKVAVRLAAECEQERQDRKQAEADVCRALGERNDARAMVDSLRSLVTTDHESKESFIYRVAVTLNMPTRAQIDAHLEERNDARAIIDATLKALPVGYIPAHTPESLPGRVADLVSELGRLTAMIEDPDEVELAMIRGDIAIPDREEFDAIRTPSGYNPQPTDP
jgi:hypothetical protein